MKTQTLKTTTTSREDEGPGLGKLRAAIPPHLFKPNTRLTVQYIIRDLVVAAGLTYLALYIPALESPAWRWILWTAYGLVQGFTFTGIWILAHECGHGALFHTNKANDTVGFVLHSLLGVPYFSWKYSHARHHRYTNHMEKDTAFVPGRKDDFRMQSYLSKVFEVAEDAPALNAAILLGHQLIGWPVYLLFAITGGPEMDPVPDAPKTWRKSHFDPLSSMWSTSQRFYILLSDVGLLALVAGLMHFGEQVGYTTVALLYGLPYLWVNHWIVAITYLHHTHPQAMHYEDNAWTYQKGALATVDRDFGFIGEYLFHGIIEFHVIHHLFPRIPFYHAEEATHCIEPILGKQYLRQDSNFLRDLWVTFRDFKYVEGAMQKPGELAWVHRSGKVLSAPVS